MRLIQSTLLLLAFALTLTLGGAALAAGHEEQENPCNPCATKAEANPCNPCAAKAGEDLPPVSSTDDAEESGEVEE